MSITDELREWVTGAKPAVVDGCSISVGTMTYGCKKALLAIADRIDAAHEKACDDAWDNGYEADYLGIEKWLTEHPQVMEHHGWVRLPLDADGKPINIGDVMEWPDGETFEVVGIGQGTLFYVDGDGGALADWTHASTKRHHHAPTVEDVLRELVAAYMDTPLDDSNDGEFFAEYAAKLRLAESEEA